MRKWRGRVKNEAAAAAAATAAACGVINFLLGALFGIPNLSLSPFGAQYKPKQHSVNRNVQ